MKEINNPELTGCIIARDIKLSVEFNSFKNINKVLLIDLISLDIIFNDRLKMLSQLIPSHLSSITSVIVFSVLASVVKMVEDCTVVYERIDMYRYI